MNEILQTAFLASLLSGMIRICTPILFASMGELIAERAGILNLSVEGMMLMGALVGFVTSYQTGSLWAGITMSVLAGALMGLVMAFLSITLQIDQVVSGLTLNLLSSGITFFIYRLVFKEIGSGNPPGITPFEGVEIPLFSQIPLVGEILFSRHMLTYCTFMMVPLIYFFLYRTKYGLTLRAIGENPRLVDMKGISIVRYQYLAVVFGGMMAATGGAYLTEAATGLFLPEISGGRGWIAIAIVIFGDWKPIRIMLMSLFFSLLDSFQLQLQGIGVQIPYQALLALPYILTVLALTLGIRRKGAPISLGIPYSRE